jgi:hypothetical protein
VTLSFLTLQFITILFTSLPKPKIFLPTSMESYNVISTTATVRTIPPLKESPMKVTSCTLVASSDLHKALDVTKDVTRGAGSPSAKMGGRPANLDGCLTMGFGRSTPPPLEVGHPAPVRDASLHAHGRGLRPTSGLSPHPTIRKEHRSVTLMPPIQGSSLQ